MVDGSPSLNISSSPLILEDSSLLTQLTITLTNPQDHSFSENLSLPPSSLPAPITLRQSDGRVLELSGAAPPDLYASVLSAVSYVNTRMTSIIENQPDFTPRQANTHSHTDTQI